MTGQSGRVVKRTVPQDKKPKKSDIPTPSTTERDKVLARMKRTEPTLDDAQAVWDELPECCKATTTLDDVLVEMQKDS